MLAVRASGASGVATCDLTIGPDESWRIHTGSLRVRMTCCTSSP